MYRMKNLLFIFHLGIASYSVDAKTCFPKVAIIGAGIGGASTSHFLTKLFNNNLEVDIYETKKIGGRLANIKMSNEEFEAGGAIIHPQNKYMKDFAELLGLTNRPSTGARFGIWNGEEFVFEESNWDYITIFKLVYRYGLQPVYLHRYVNKILDDFNKIYDIQEKGTAFDNVASLIGAMNKDFLELLQTPIKKHLMEMGYDSRLIDELVKATIVVNYGQDIDVQSFVSCVSIAGAGFDLWSVKGGNKRVPEQLIFTNKKINLKNATTVDKIKRLSIENRTMYELSFKKNENQSTEVYDIVVIAAPMTQDQQTSIVFENFKNQDLTFMGTYQRTIATFVDGSLNFSYFGLKDSIDGILSCDPNKTQINSIGKLSSVEGSKKSNVWKIFSRESLDKSTLNKMFSKINDVKTIKWKAYPQYSSKLRFDRFKLDDALYHVNAIEWAASAMEMSAIGGRNTAILAFNDYQEKCSLTTSSKKLQTSSPEL